MRKCREASMNFPSKFFFHECGRRVGGVPRPSLKRKETQHDEEEKKHKQPQNQTKPPNKNQKPKRFQGPEAGFPSSKSVSSVRQRSRAAHTTTTQPSQNLQIIEQETFLKCTSLQEVCIPSSLFWHRETTRWAFSRARLAEQQLIRLADNLQVLHSRSPFAMAALHGSRRHPFFVCFWHL